MKRKKALLCSILVVAVVIGAVVSAGFGASADMVNVYTETNPELTLAQVYAPGGSGFQPDGTLVQNGSTYTIKTYSWCFWYQIDSLSFAYKQIPFNTGRGSLLTVETTLTDWDGLGNATAGIHIRNSLDADSVGIHLGVRPGQMYFMYRKSTGENVNQGILVPIPEDKNIDYGFRIVMDKTRNNAEGFYKMIYPDAPQNNTGWISVGKIPYQSTSQVYAGLSPYSAQEQWFTAVFDGLTMKLDAPEGYEIDEGDTSGSGSGTASEEPEIVLPEDLPAPGDALLHETFTDGNLFPEKPVVTDPLWTVKKGAPAVGIDEAQTNRYLLLSATDEPLFMYAGDMEWADYSVSADILFDSNDYYPSEANHLTLLVRHKSVGVGGSMDYGITLVNKFKNDAFAGQYLQLNYRTGQSTYIPQYTTLKEVLLSENEMLERDTVYNLKVDVFDNTIAVYFNGEKIITWDDTDRVGQTYNTEFNETNYPNLLGCIGIYSAQCSAQLDNLTVRKLEDPFGGAYDNQIGGRFEQPVPDYLRERIANAE